MQAQAQHIIPTLPASSFDCHRFDEPRFVHTFHYHPEIEFHYVEQSSGTLLVGDHVGSFSPQDLCVLGENLPHYFRTTPQDDQHAVSEVLLLPRDFCAGLIDCTPELGPFFALLERAKRGLRYAGKIFPDAGKRLGEIRQASGIRRLTLFLDFTQRLLEAPEPEVLASSGYTGHVEMDTSDCIRRACQYILRNFDQELSHRDIAAHVNLSPAYFSRLFKDTTRRSYTTFLTEVRLGHACHLLTESDLPILEVSLNSGFQNLSNFNRRFKAVYNCSPRNFRRLHAPSIP